MHRFGQGGSITDPFTDWVLLPLPVLHLEGYREHQYFSVCSLRTSMQKPGDSFATTVPLLALHAASGYWYAYLPNGP